MKILLAVAALLIFAGAGWAQTTHSVRVVVENDKSGDLLKALQAHVGASTRYPLVTDSDFAEIVIVVVCYDPAGTRVCHYEAYLYAADVEPLVANIPHFNGLAWGAKNVDIADTIFSLFVIATTDKAIGEAILKEIDGVTEFCKDSKNAAICGRKP